MKTYSLYQPRITDENVRRLYELKRRTGRPMTRLLNAIIDSFFCADPQGRVTDEGRTVSGYRSSTPQRGEPAFEA